MARPQYVKFVSPKGIAIYPKLNRPDSKFDADGVYSTRLEDNEETRKFIAKLVAVRDDFFEEQDAKIRKKFSLADVFEEELNDEGEETGFLIVKFKLNAKVKTKDGTEYDQKPNLFDSSKPPKPLDDCNPWSGSTLRVAGDIVPYAMGSSKTVGVSLRMKGVQVINLVQGGGAEAASYGFSDEEGGFTVDTSAFDDESDFSEDEDF